MAAIGGPIQSVSIRGRLFPVAADADGNRKLGGYENEVKSNGDGSARLIKSRVPWSMMGLKLSIDDSRSDQEFLKGIADGTDMVPMVFNFVSGISYQGSGQIVGELTYTNQDTTSEIGFSGPGEASQQ